MDYLLPVTAIIGIWAFLSLLGSERDRRSKVLDYQISRVTAQRAVEAQIAEAAARRQQQSQSNH